MIPSLTTFGLSILFGFGPPLVWLTLWLQEDASHPEPRSAVIRTFIIGALMVLPAILLEAILQPYFASNPLLIFSAWAIIEEGLKLCAVLLVYKYFMAPIDEPIDWLIYMITAALGFAALENTLFLIQPFSGDILMEGLVVSNLRFMGATVLHLVASATHGAALGLCFYLSEKFKHRYYILGFTAAVLVHIAFNYFLVIGSQSVISVVSVFAGVWLLLLPLILIFEKIKTLRRGLN